MLKARLVRGLVNPRLSAKTSHNNSFVNTKVTQRSDESAEVKARKARKRNFFDRNYHILAEQVEEHLSLFQSKLTNESTNKEIWNEVKSAAVNAAGFESDDKSRSPEKVEVSPFGSEEGIFRISKEWEKTGNGARPKCLSFAKNPLTSRRPPNL